MAAWPAARQRFLTWLDDRQTFFITTRLRDAAGHMQQVFVAVDCIEAGRVDGRLWSDLATVACYRRGPAITAPEVDIVDWMIFHPGVGQATSRALRG